MHISCNKKEHPNLWLTRAPHGAWASLPVTLRP